MNQLLPKAAYLDDDFFQLEQRYIFSKCWAFAGLVEDVAQQGDYITVQAGLNNIFITRDENAQLVAFHNMCRHRGTRLLEGKGQLKNRLTCPYHDWSYDLQGKLASLPKQRSEFADIDKSCLGLKKAQVSIFKGMIWVHPDVKAEPLIEWLEPIAKHLGPHEVESLVESTEDMLIAEINANWKIVVENYIDHYHLAQLHARTLNMYDHKKAEFAFVGHHFRFWEPLTKEYAQNLEKNAPQPLIEHPPECEYGAWVPMIFPGIGLAATECSWSVFHITPITADKTRVLLRSKVKDCSSFEYLKQSAKSSQYWHRKMSAKHTHYTQDHPLGSGDFLQEDIYVCEQLQKSMASPYFEFGPSALHGESPIREHQALIWRTIAPFWLRAKDAD